MNVIKFENRNTIKLIFLSNMLLLILGSCGGLFISNTQKSIDHEEEFIKANEQFKPSFEATISSIYQEYGLSGDFLLAVVNENGLAYSFALNDHILNSQEYTLGNNSPIYIASHTKSFTGILLKALDEEGVIDLDESIHHYLPELILGESIDTKQITVRQLLNHTHGIHSTQVTWKTAFLGYGGQNQELIDAFNANFRYDPSHQFRYSNMGPILAAMIVEKVTGRSWKEEMRERVFLPLNMQRTSAKVSDFDKDLILPAYTVKGNGDVVSSGFYKEDITMHAAGGIISTINDLSKWLQANINHDQRLLVNEISWSDMHESTTAQDRTYFTYNRNAYSLGWDIANYEGDTILTRFGGYAGISFHASFIPSRKIGIIAFSNDSRASKLPHLAANYAYNLINSTSEADSILNEEQQLFEKDYEKRSQQPQPRESDRLTQNNENDKIIGHYRNDLGWPGIEISFADSNYYMQWGVLNGPVYRIPYPEQPFLGRLGALDRTFNIKTDSLFTGSLKYVKQIDVPKK